MEYMAGANLINGIAQGFTGYYDAKASGYYQQGQIYAQLPPQFQVVAYQAKELSNAQLLSFMDNGVDISQGTARGIIKKTLDNANSKIDELYRNAKIQANNVNKISKANATNALVSGIAQGITSAAQTYLYGDLMKQQGNNYFMHGQNKGTSSQMGR